VSSAVCTITHSTYVLTYVCSAVNVGPKTIPPGLVLGHTLDFTVMCALSFKPFVLSVVSKILH